MYSAPATPQYAYAPPMPTFERGGRVKETYGLENAAEMIRRRGRGDDTILAHINPQEAGILKLLGGSGTTNPYTGLPEFKFLPGIKSIPIIGKPLYKAGSQIGKAIESGVESIAKALGPVGSIAAAYFGGPIGAALYQGLAAPGSSFDTKNAIKAAALTYAGNTLSGAENAWAPQFDYGSAFGGDMSYVPTGDVSSAASGAPSVNEAVSIGGSMDASGIGTGVDAAAGGPSMGTAPAASAPYGNIASDTGAGADFAAQSGEGFNYNAASTNIDAASTPTPNMLERGYSAVKEGIGGILPESVKDYIPTLSQAKDIALIASGATTAYGAYKTKQELDAAKAEAERVLADQANRKKEEVEWAQGVMRDYPYNYKRLTEEEVRSERGMAMGGRIDSYDDEIGGDDNMMQGGIASLAKGGLPPRYLRGGGDGMSDSIRANIEGKQEARLADGEFVVPADVVSHLGNGSSNAGAKKLYAMMDRVRKSRTGKTRQAPEVNTRGMMPA